MFDFESSLALQLFFDSLKLDESALGIKRAPPSNAHQGPGPERQRQMAAEPGVEFSQHLVEANADDFFSAGVPADGSFSYPAPEEFPESRTDDFDDFFQATPQPQPQGQSQQQNVDFFQNPPQSKSEVSLPNHDVDLFVLGQSHPAGQSSASTEPFQGQKSAELPTKPSSLEHQGSSNDFFEQLEGLSLSRGQGGHDKEPGVVAKTILNELPDLSFMLADQLLVPGGGSLVTGSRRWLSRILPKHFSWQTRASKTWAPLPNWKRWRARIFSRPRKTIVIRWCHWSTQFPTISISELFTRYCLLTLEELLLRTSADNWCLLNDGTSPPSIVMGISGKPEKLLEVEKVVKDGVPVIKRFSGGGTVIVDEGTLFVTLICSRSALPSYA
ncbi:hypothetical protein R1flu_001446 [Riccia fluitans]|uniref:BPL/LPL catalytic domain-containing protein n=1 Tax=Riccia fluitans TaxID=41844 RepID=A0ABD1Y3M9_9MARC